MADINDGGPAFPTLGRELETEGMSLRDHFAGLALSGLLVDVLNHPFGADWVEATARDSYALADAMLKAREVRNG